MRKNKKIKARNITTPCLCRLSSVIHARLAWKWKCSSLAVSRKWPAAPASIDLLVCIVHFQISFPLFVSDVIENVQQKHPNYFHFLFWNFLLVDFRLNIAANQISIRQHFDIDYPRGLASLVLTKRNAAPANEIVNIFVLFNKRYWFTSLKPLDWV